MRPAVLLAVLLGAAASAVAQPQALVDLFERRSIESNGLTVSYALYVPEGYDPAREYPLVMAFHGAGERGTNLVNIERHRLATAWVEPAVQAKHPAFVLAPQVPSGLRWTSDTDPDASAFVPIQLATLDILAAVEAEFSIDPDRIYAVGLSLGGHATWDFVSRLPTRFAAAVPMSGRGFPSQADDVLHVPVWAFTGETDTVVPPSQTRRVVQAMEDLGRDVVYTDCRRSPVEARAFDCGAIGQDSLAEAVAAHADLLYTSQPTVGHGPWAPWFDHPLLADWLFSKARVDPDAVAITAPAAGARWTGTEAVTWTTARTTEDTVEVWVRPAGTFAGTKVGEAPIADGAFAVDTEAFRDAGLAEVRLVVRDAAGRFVGAARSAPFAIDNAGDAAPALRLDAEDLRFDPRLGDETYTLRFTASDPEGGALVARVAYSADGGATYTTVQTEAVTSGVGPQSLVVDVAALPNTRSARLRLEVDDRANTASAETAVFLKQTPRDVRDAVERVAGDGEGAVLMHFIDPDALTGHRYRIAIDDADPEAKTYTVTDLTEAETVLADVPFSDGLQESPVFDGMALVVEDLEEGRADLDETGWIAGDTDLEVTVSGGSVRISILTVDLLATETDYEIALTEAVAGRSLSLYRIPEADLRFTVTAGGEARDVVFQDADGDGWPGAGDVLYIVEPDAGGAPELAWQLTFGAATVPPEAGDVFRLVPVRSLSAADVFEFEARFDVAAEPGPGADLALDAFPNPAAGPLTVGYRLGAPASVTVDVFDVLGRHVGRVDEGPRAAGDHRAVWDAEAAAGVYVVRLTATPEVGAAAVRTRAVVRVVR